MTAQPLQLPTLSRLTDELRAARQAEEAAKAHRIRVEESILNHPEVAAQVKEDGTATVGDVRITSRLNRKWDQVQLAALAGEVDDAYWPFRAEWKEDRQASKVLEERFPDLWDRLCAALTLKPAKPSVTPK
jgi:hypothetical protein